MILAPRVVSIVSDIRSDRNAQAFDSTRRKSIFWHLSKQSAPNNADKRLPWFRTNLGPSFSSVMINDC